MKDFGEVGGILLYNDPDTVEKELEITPTNNGAFWYNLEEPDELRTHLDYETNDDIEKNKKLKKSEKKKLEKIKKEK